jgi:hypothetical protein
MAEQDRHTPIVTSAGSDLQIQYIDGDTYIKQSGQVKVEGYVPTSDIYRMMAGTEKTLLTRVSKIAIKNMPPAPALQSPAPPQPMYWNGDATHDST